MKSVYMAVSAWGLLLAFQGAPAKTPTLCIGIVPSSYSFSAKTPVKVKMTITNESDKDVSLEEGSLICDYTIDVRDQENRITPGKELRQQTKCPKNGEIPTEKDIIVVLGPHESYTAELVLSDLNDLSHAGVYTVQVSRVFAEAKADGAISSKKIVIHVTP